MSSLHGSKFLRTQLLHWLFTMCTLPYGHHAAGAAHTFVISESRREVGIVPSQHT